MSSNEEPKPIGREQRKNGLIKALAACQGMSLEKQAEFIMSCNFDYVPYIARKSAIRAVENYQKYLEGSLEEP